MYIYIYIYYLEVMSRLCEAIRQKRTELDFAPRFCTMMLVLEFLAKNKTANMPQGTYSPDLAPLTFSPSQN